MAVKPEGHGGGDKPGPKVASVPAAAAADGGAEVNDPIEKLEVSFEKCVETLGAASRPKSLARPIQWIHIPKAGTSWGAVIHGYLCQIEPAPYANPNPRQGSEKGYQNCTYCGDRKGEGKHLGNGQWWDPKLRNLIPFSNKYWKGKRHRNWEYYAPYCDWTQTPYPPYSNHFTLGNPLRNWKTVNDVLVLFREPRKRLVSSWNNNKHSYGTGGRVREEGLGPTNLGREV